MIDPRKQALGALSAEALKENPTDPSVRALAARVAAHRDEPVAIADLLGALDADPAASATMRIDLADALLTKPGSTLEDARQAAQILEPLVRLDSPVVEAVALWANAAFLAGDAPASLIPALEAASRRVPHNTKLLAYLAAANVAVGDLGKAREWYNRIILVSTSPEQRLWAQKQADSPRLQEQQPAAQ
jgi:predicted Zn-dependent protease